MQTVPKAYHKEFGCNISSAILIKCQNCVWRAKYSAEAIKIWGLRRFMIFYGVDLFNLVQFDYYGDDIFFVTIFKETGIESKYPVISPLNFFESEEGKEWKKRRLIPEHGNMDYEKNAAMFTFNGLRNVRDYYDIDIVNSYTDDNFQKMVSNLLIFSL